jgi:hypothetical protein
MTVHGVLILLLLADANPASDFDLRANAWDRSVAREVAGDLVEAERIMVEGWGASTDNYWVSLRLAYLALLQGRYHEAAQRYQALRSRPEAEFDADVVEGHRSATTAARAKQTLPVAPELWGILTSNSLGMYQYRGWGAYLHVPVRLTERVVVRAAGRFIAASRTSARSPWAFSSRDDSWTLNEEYLGVAWNSPSVGFEAGGARSATSDEAALLGGGAGLRAGRTWGGTLQASFLRKSGLASNWQLLPRAFVWPSPHLGLQAGGRATLDGRGNSLSGSLGLSTIWQPVALYLQAFLGRERWAFDFEGPSIMSFDSESTYGGTVTATWTAAANLRFALQGDGARLHEDSAWGSYWSLSLGIHYGPELR